MKHTVASAKLEIELTTHVLCNKCGGHCNAGMKKDDPKRFVQPGGRDCRSYMIATSGLHNTIRNPSKLPDGSWTDQHFNGIIECTVEGVYGSDSLEDMTSYTFSVCEHCLREFFDTFKIAPTTRDVCFG